MFFVKKIRIYKLKAFAQVMWRDFLYLINLPAQLNLTHGNTLRIPKKNKITTVEQWKAGHEYINYQEIRPQSNMEVTEKYSLNGLKPKQFSKNLLFFPKVFILKIKSAHLTGDGLVITSDNKILSDFYNEMGKELIHNIIFTKWNLPKPILINKAAALIDKQSNCYFHWLFDVLPRLFILLDNGHDKIEKYLFYKLEYRFQLETLDLLGISLDKIIQTDKNSLFKVAELIVPSLPGTSGVVPLESCRILREKMLDKNIVKDVNYQKIYISRSKAGARRIINEKEFMATLEKLGFKCLNLEDYKLTDQIKIFYSAKIVISPHGSGLSNLVFCEPKTKAIEIFSDTFLNDCYRNLSNHCDLDYYYYIESANKLTSDDITINENNFIKLLKENKIL
jgi:capsular polysaccharide biosynthesis protein